MGHPFVLLILVSAFSTALGEEVACRTGQVQCSQGYSSLSYSNNDYYCCSPGYSMSWSNNQCFCNGMASNAVKCDEGAACSSASTLSINNGVTRCCQAGYNMQSSSTSINGQPFRSCTCTRFGNGGGVQVISSGSSSFSGSGSNSNFDADAFARRMNRFRQSLNGRLRNMTDNLQRRLAGGLFRNIGV